ncbi:palmitoyltransferase [Achlya hypogyna]|uniref:Palmitoyltransferase n=1 Tax=Achlya hypogyna TaxID=1202772 RepID=A0A1V9ZLZ4_ACHHY|nr:palmitoyltransferase [Achlya hypogyna]
MVVVRAAKRVWAWFFEERNCIFQVFYLTLLTISYGVLVTEAWGSLGLGDQIIAAFFALSCAGLFFRVSLADPGVITLANIRDQQVYADHDALYPRGRVCRTCKTIKIPRSKHCRVCDHCVARFDHHCIWVNTCIAKHNYNAFFCFLVTNVCGSAHLVYILCAYFIHKMTAKIANAHDLSRDFASQVLTEIISSPEHARVAFVASLSIGVWFLVSLLLGCQMGRVVRNCTANEHFKRQRLRKDHAEDDPAPKRPVALDMAWGGVGLVDEVAAQALSVDDIERNPYDKGVMYNMRDAFDLGAKDKSS